MTPTAWVRAAVAVAALAALGAGCTDGDGSGGCGPVRREPLDARSVHVLPGGEDAAYETDPPTSGPHLPGPEMDPVAEEPIPKPIQVGLLEEGGVLIQHHGLDEAQRAEVEGLAGDGVVVAPADALPEGAQVVATAWVTKQVCDGVDVAALRAFAEDYVDATSLDHG